MEAPEFLEPIIDSLPPEIQPFVKAGGWLIPLGLIALIVLAIFVSALRRTFARRRPALRESDLTEHLGDYPLAPALWGNRRLALHGLPVRLRLIVAAPLGHEGGYVHAEQVEQMLDLVFPGLGPFVRADQPRVRVWPTQLSFQGFTASFRRHTVRPDAERQLSRWVLLMGKGLINRRPVAIGFALLADSDNTLGWITLEQPHEWMQALRVVG
jgi:hypothetical protein